MKSTPTLLVIFLFFATSCLANFDFTGTILEENAMVMPCSLAIPATCGQSFFNHSNIGNTNHFNSDSYGGCFSGGAAFDAPDVVYEVNVTQRGNMRFVLKMQPGIDLDMFFFDDCTDPAFQSADVCLAATLEDNVGSQIYTEVLDVIADPGIYYLIVDGYNSEQVGNYDLIISCERTCTEEPDPNSPFGRNILSENFENYVLNNVDNQSSRWRRWNQCSTDAIVQEQNGNNQYLQVEDFGGGTASDALYLLDNQNSGRYRLSWDMLMETGRSGYYNIQHGLQDFTDCNTTTGANWAYEVYLNEDGTGDLIIDQAQVTTFNYSIGQWNNVMQIIDINQDRAELWINHRFIWSWKFSEGSSPSSVLSAVNFFGATNDKYWVDDICLWEVTGNSCTFIFDPVCIKNGEQWTNNCFATRFGLFTPIEIYPECYGVCDQGGLMTHLGDTFSGTLDPDDLAPPLLLSEPCVLEAYGGQLPPGPMYADIQVMYIDEFQPDGIFPELTGVTSDETKVFAFRCHCNGGSCFQEPLGEVGGSGACAYCEDNFCGEPGFYYLAILSPVNDTYSLTVTPSGECEAILQSVLTCPVPTIQGSVADGSQQFNAQSTYATCYNGLRSYNGREVAYRLDIKNPAFVTISLNTEEEEMGIFVFDYLCGKNCIAYDENPVCGGLAQIDSIFLDEGAYYIVVDKETSTGDESFNMDITCDTDQNFAHDVFGINLDIDCPVDNTQIHNIGIKYSANSSLSPDHLISFFVEDNGGSKKLIKEMSQYWNGLDPMVFAVPKDTIDPANEKCSYDTGDPFFIGLFDTGEGSFSGGLCEIGFVGDDNVTFQAGQGNEVDNLDFLPGNGNFNLSPSYFQLAAAAAVKSMQVLTNVPWHIEFDPAIDWLHFSPENAGAASAVNIVIDQNDLCIERDAEITFVFEADATIYRTLTIVQRGECIVPIVNILPSPTVIICAGNPVTLEANLSNNCANAFDFLWSNGETTPSITVQPLNPTDYTVTVTSRNCRVMTNRTVQVITTPAPLAPGFSGTTEFCENETISLTVSTPPGTTAYWFDQPSGGNVVNLTNTYNPTPGMGTHTWYVESKQNNVDCFSGLPRTEVSITVYADPVANVDSPMSLNCNGSVVLDASNSSPASASFQWSGPGIVQGGNTATPTVNLPGNYAVTVTTGPNCTDETSVNVGQIPPPNVEIINPVQVLCHGENTGSATAMASGGSPGYSYAWSNGASGPTANNLPMGFYGVTITDQDGCTDEAFVQIGEPPVLTLALIGQTNINCNGSGTASVNANGGTPGYFYQWSNGIIGANANFSSPGTYNVTVTDNNGCTKEVSVLIESTPEPVIFISTHTDVDCFGESTGSATVSVSNGSPPYNVVWSNGSTGLTADNLATGFYTATVTDADGCTKETGIQIDQSDQIVVNASAEDETSNLGDGSVEADPTGGVPGFTYQWFNEAGDLISTQSSVSNLPPQNYTVIVTDNEGCTNTQTVTVIPFECLGIAVGVSIKHVDCFGEMTGEATAIPTGSAPFTYEWSTGETGIMVEELAAGQYTVTMTDTDGCSETLTFNVDQPTAATTSIDAQENVDCFGNSTGSASLSTTGGTIPYNYLWPNGSNGSGLSAGTYEVTIEDGNDCKTFLSVSITEPDELIANPDATDVSAQGAEDGTVTVNPTGGTTDYSFEWENEDGSNTYNVQSVFDLAPGTYFVTVTDANGCTATDITVVQPFDCTGVGVDINTTDASCFGFMDGEAFPNPTGGTAPFTYEWSNGSTDPSPDNLDANDYSVTMTDGNNCEAIVNFTINEPPDLDTLSVVVINDVGGQGNGSVNVSLIGGTPPYDYIWTDENGNFISNEEDINNLMKGVYHLLVTDANGCEYTFSNIEVDDVDAVYSKKLSANDLFLYPNPSDGKVFFRFSEPVWETVEITVLDILGAAVYFDKVISLGKSTRELNLSIYAKGVYLVKFNIGQQVVTKKIVLQ